MKDEEHDRDTKSPKACCQTWRMRRLSRRWSVRHRHRFLQPSLHDRTPANHGMDVALGIHRHESWPRLIELSALDVVFMHTDEQLLCRLCSIVSLWITSSI